MDDATVEAIAAEFFEIGRQKPWGACLAQREWIAHTRMILERHLPDRANL